MSEKSGRRRYRVWLPLGITALVTGMWALVATAAVIWSDDD